MDARQLAEDAAAWLIRLEEDASPACKAEFSAWLARSPLHVEQYLLVTAAYRELDGLDPAHEIDVASLGDGTTGAGSNIVSLGATVRRYLGRETSAAQQPQSPRRARTAWYVAGLAATLSVLAIGVWRLAPSWSTENYATAIGEQRAIKLGDDSVVQLNTRSKVQVRLSDDAREVRLVEGEALFAVEHDPKRPFRVVSDNAVIQAIGTQFNVYRHGGATTVAVVQGAVKISTAQDAGETLKAGQVAVIDNAGDVKQRATDDVSRQIAWRQRKLDFRGATLNEVAEQFNRYNRLSLRIDSEEIAHRKLNGVFNADEPHALLDFLAQDPNVEFRKSDGEIVIRERSAQPSLN